MLFCTPASASRSDHKTGSAYIVVGSLVTEPPTHESIKVGTRLETDYSTHVGATALSKKIATHPRTDVLITSARSAETKRHVQIVCTLRPRIPAASCREFPHCLQAKASCREFQGNRAAYCTMQFVRRLPCSSPVIYYYHYPCLSLPIITTITITILITTIIVIMLLLLLQGCESKALLANWEAGKKRSASMCLV